MAPCVLAPVHLIDLGGEVVLFFRVSRSLKATRSLLAANDLGRQRIRQGYRLIMPKRQSFLRFLSKNTIRNCWQQSRITY